MIDKGELYDCWKHLPVNQIHRMQEKDFIVFTNSDSNLDWEMSDNNISSKNYDIHEHNKLISRLTYVNTLDFNIKEEKIRNQFHELLADAFSNIYNCDYRNAETGLSTAENYIVKFHNTKTRIWSLCSTLFTTLPLIILGIVLLVFVKQEDSIYSCFVYSLFGALGVLIASFLNINKKNLLIEYGKNNIITESIIHVVVGIMITFTILLLIKCNLIVPMLNNIQFGNSDLILAILLGIIGESLFPKIITEFYISYSK